MAGTLPNIVYCRDDTFQRAKDDFLSQLSARDRQRFLVVNSPEELLSQVQYLAETLGSKHKGAKLLGVAGVLKDSLEPYLEALGLIVQGASGYAAIVWGVIRLVLQVSTALEFVDETNHLSC